MAKCLTLCKIRGLCPWLWVDDLTCLIGVGLLGTLGHTGRSNTVMYSEGCRDEGGPCQKDQQRYDLGWRLWVTPRGLKTGGSAYPRGQSGMSTRLGSRNDSGPEARGASLVCVVTGGRKESWAPLPRGEKTAELSLCYFAWALPRVSLPLAEVHR